MATTVVKKYSNRRLYDTEESRYITLEELTERVRRGRDVRVVDAKTNEDLTQQTLVQIILETSAAKLLPAPLCARLIRMKDDALAEFFGRYVSAALDVYLGVKNGAQTVAPFFPLAQVPFTASQAMARALGTMPGFGDVASALLGGFAGYGQGGYGGGPAYPQQGYAPSYPAQAGPFPPPPPPSSPAAPASGDPGGSPPPPAPSGADVAALRSELEALRRELRADKSAEKRAESAAEKPKKSRRPRAS